ncbi:MAG: hypothetical protein M0Z79_04165 [Nitrospiraceae bacterium]|nr:hypothetical protein [Nitrospiraceae bacterium]
MRKIFLWKIIAGLLPLLVLAASANAQHGWPIEAMGSEHPIGNSFGEFQDFSGVYQHTGIDILETPKFQADGTQDPAAPWVRATVGGTVSQLGDAASTAYNGTTIQGTDGTTYRYWHLEHSSYDPSYVTNFNNGTAVAAGGRIAQLVRWGCNYHHLHYDLTNGGNYLNPMADITPNPDPDAPEIGGIFFAQDNSNPWVQLQPVSPGACTVVSGAVDIIAQIRDRDNAGSTLAGAATVWVRNVRWRACPDSNPDCPWQNTFVFDNMPTANGSGGNAASAAYFSNRAPWDSSSDYCSATWIYSVVTNFVGGSPNAAGTWDTSAIPNGSYSVSVEATDFAGNVRVSSVRACVQNTPACTTELTIRDAADDNGAIPYPGGNWWESPDITANPGTPDEDHNINVGAANPIQVRVWNYGSCNLAAGTTYNVCLGWALPSGTVPYPLPAGQVIGCTLETVPGGGFPVGTNRVTTYTWTPASGSVPLGHHCLVAWVDTAQDSVANTPAVNWDDNRAQQNITFKAAPAPGAPGYSSFWIYPQEMIKERSLELTFKNSGPKPGLREVKVHVPPGVTVKRVVGGQIIGGYKGKRPADPCKQSGPCKDICLSSDAAQKQGCTLVISGIDPAGHLRLEGIQVRKAAEVKLEVWSEKDVKKGQFTRVEVVEYGLLPEHRKITPVGGLTVRFDH